MYISYRNKMRLKSLLIGLAIALVILIAIAVCVVVYLQRYVVYTADGAHLDFSTRPGAEDTTGGNPNFQVEQLTPLPDAPLEIQETPDTAVASHMQTVSGVYVTADMLSDPEAVLAALPEGDGVTAVMLDLKSIYGNYYYSSALPDAEASSAVDAEAVDQLIETLAKRTDLYLIARIPAFRDSSYALANQDCGLPLDSGALWMDDASCYWLDPANDKVVSHLESLALELQTMGFDEVVFSDFYFPSSSNIVYDGDGSAAVLQAAQRLQQNLSGEELVFSIATTDPTLAAYAGRCYIEEDDGAQVSAIVQTFSDVYATPEEQLVFITNSRDTRFAEYGLLRPALETESSQ